MAEVFDLSGRVSVGVDGDVGEPARRAMRALLDPFEASHGGASADVLVRGNAPAAMSGTELLNPASDGLVTAHDAGGGARLMRGDSWVLVPRPESQPPLELRLSPGFVPDRTFGGVLRFAMQRALVGRGFVAVHAAAVELDGGAILVAGWSESGKTETALALIEHGATFLTDKWTILGEDGASAFPIGVGIRRWVMPYLPRLRASLPRTASYQFRAAAVAARAAAPLRRAKGGGAARAAADAAARAVALADRAGLTPSELRAAYGQRDDPGRLVPLRAVVLLSNHADSAVVPGSAVPVRAAARLARSAAYERRPWDALHQRMRYADGDDDGGDDLMERERVLLEPWLAAARLIGVRAPFPVDPRRVAEVVLHELRA